MTAHPARRTARTITAALVPALLTALALGPPAGATAVAPDDAPTRADGTSSWRARYHHTVPDRWKNDPQRPVVIDGVTHYWYLYNADYPDRVGTAWRLATSTDDVVFTDQGVAAPKATNANYDLWSGSVVVDETGTAGFGAGALVMMVTQMDHPTPEQIADASGPQAQFLWYSLDGGRTFRPDGEHPVLANGGRRDFRDPKVLWDDARGRWVALVAEGDAVSFWTSPDLRTWEHASQLVLPGLGLLECPDLFELTADDGTRHWVLGLSANGYATGDPATFAYWTGGFDGTSFTPGHDAPRWLDHGFDWYGAVTWPDASDPEHRRRAIAWMNSWSYPFTTPTWEAEGYNGTDSVVRELVLRRYADGYALASSPVAGLAGHATHVESLGDLVVDGRVPLAATGTAYQLETTVTWEQATNVGLQLRVSHDGARHADVGVHDGYSYLNRGGTGHPSADGSKVESRARHDPAARQVRLRVLVDSTTVEVFVDDGRTVHSSQVFADPGDDGIALYALDGPATFRDVTVTHYADVTGRPARLLADFEDGALPAGWTSTGDLAGIAPVAADLRGQAGTYVLDTYASPASPGDGATGTVTSAPFVADRRYLHLLLAGGDHPLGVEPATSVQLLLDGAPVRTATGSSDGTLRPVRWDLSDLAGRTVQLQVLDDATGDWGHLMVDHVLLAD